VVLVKSKNSVYNQGKTQNTTNFTYNSVTANQFAPLEYLEEPQSVTPTTKNKDQEIMSTRQQYGGLKIPTIVNGIINSPRRSKLSKIKSSVIPCKVPPSKIPQRKKKHDK
jgi:hypothetical protein